MKPKSNKGKVCMKKSKVIQRIVGWRFKNSNDPVLVHQLWVENNRLKIETCGTLHWKKPNNTIDKLYKFIKVEIIVREVK